MTSPKLDIIVIFVVIVFSVCHYLSATGNDVDLRRFSLHLLQWTFAYPRTHCIAKYSAHPVTSLTELYRTHKVLYPFLDSKISEYLKQIGYQTSEYSSI